MRTEYLKIFIQCTIQIDSKTSTLAPTYDNSCHGPKRTQSLAIKSMVIEAFYDYYDYNVDANIQILPSTECQRNCSKK